MSEVRLSGPQPEVPASRSRTGAVACLALLVLATVAISKAPEFLFSRGGEWWSVWLTHEDGPYEAYGALSCLAAAFVFFRCFQIAKPIQPGGYRNGFFLLLGSGLLLMFLEEVSWGQRLFAIAVPEWLEKANIQRELNLHNLRIFHPSLDDNRLKRIWVFASLGYLGLLPLAAIIPPVGAFLKRWRLPLASWPLAIATLAGFAMYIVDIPRLVRAGDLYAAHDAGEAVETVFEAAYLVLAIETWWRVRRHGSDATSRIRWLVVALVWFALFGVLTWGLAKPAIHGDRHLEAVAWLRRGNRAAATNAADQALICYDKSIALWPEQAEPHLRAGAILIEQREPRAAELHLRKAIELNPENAETYNNLGVVQAEQQKWDQAIASFTKALEINPASQQARSNRNAVQAKLRNEQK